MTSIELLLLIALVVTVVASGVALVRTVHTDGLGHGDPPRSHEPWDVQGWGEPLRR
jgi:hypothetical protein